MISRIKGWLFWIPKVAWGPRLPGWMPWALGKMIVEEGETGSEGQSAPIKLW